MGCGASTDSKVAVSAAPAENSAPPAGGPADVAKDAAAAVMETVKSGGGPADCMKAAAGVATGFAAGAASSVRGHRKDKAKKAKKAISACRTEARKLDWSCADPERWSMLETEFNGGMSYRTQPEMEEEAAPIEEGKQKLRECAERYLGMFYQTSMTEWPEDQQKYTLIKRTKSGFKVAKEEGGGFTYIEAIYKALEPEVEVVSDEKTDGLSYQGNALPEPLKPGRGHGVADVPMIKIMGDVDPNDIAQGGVGDCWLLSAISAMAEFDGAIHHLFQNTPDIDSMPKDEANTYTVSLYDLTTWEQVDVVVDERLCSSANGAGLLGCNPTITGELWTCYLEKACAIHCGGWDKIDGGQCTHAWRMLTGCKNQYTFRDSGDGYGCYGAYNPNEERWEELANSPHDGFKGLWPMAWPEVGGGGDLSQKIDHKDMFERMCMWDDNSYIMGCGTKAGSDSEDTDGIVDGHAYTILECIDNAGGTEFDMVKVRNPWGKGEFKSGRWDDDGPGWGEYPAVKEACQPVMADDGVFWVDREEFFQYFHTIYLCAKDMSEFV